MAQARRLRHFFFLYLLPEYQIEQGKVDIFQKIYSQQNLSLSQIEPPKGP